MKKKSWLTGWLAGWLAGWCDIKSNIILFHFNFNFLL